MKTRLILALVLASFSAACATPRVRNLATPLKSVLDEPLASRDCRIAVRPVVDARPETEKLGGRDNHYHHNIFGLFFYSYKRDAIIQHEAEAIRGEAASADLTDALRRTLAARGPCEVSTSDDAELVLESEIEHMYGVSGAREKLFVGPAGHSSSRTVLLPTGQLTIRFSLRNRDGVTLHTWRASAKKLLSTKAIRSKADLGKHISDPMSLALVEATQRLLWSLPEQLELAVSERAPLPSAERDTFTIARLSSDRRFIEVALVDRAAGTIMSSEVTRPRAPGFSEPGQWVLSPYQPHRLSREQYLELVRELASDYDVAFRDDAGAATFRGLR